MAPLFRKFFMGGAFSGHTVKQLFAWDNILRRLKVVLTPKLNCAILLSSFVSLSDTGIE